MLIDEIGSGQCLGFGEYKFGIWDGGILTIDEIT